MKENLPDFTPDLTPIEQWGDMWAKRDDLYCMAGICGGKVRACWHLAQIGMMRLNQMAADTGNAAQLLDTGLITASSRSSPQAQIVARLAARMDLPARLHMPEGKLTEEMQDILDHGGDIIQHKAGYNSVIISRAIADCLNHPNWTYIPFGMESREAMNCTIAQVRNIPAGVKRIVVVIGSGMTAAGILWGLHREKLLGTIPVLGIQVGADPTKRLDRYAPPMWRTWLTIEKATVDYHDAVNARLSGVRLDPHYEAKVAGFLRSGDLFWIVGIRAGLE